MPSHHSHSSHSSFHSSFHSSSSRSFSHSSSPSFHSSSSHSSSFRTSSPSLRGNKYSSGNRNYMQNNKPRPNIGVWHSLNNSRGYSFTPRYYTSTHHHYVYIPSSWIDDYGHEWQAGYYNEEGTYAKNLNKTDADSPFESSVLCTCEYCGHSAVYNAEKMDTINLTCPNCGATMVVSSFQDKISETTNDNYTYQEEERIERQRKRSNSMRLFFIVALVVVFFPIFFNRLHSLTSHYQNYTQPQYTEDYHQQSTNNQQQYASNPDIFGNTIYLAKNSNGNYSITSNQSEAKYVLKYDQYEDSYYCPELDEWFWHNTDVVPSVWQYWTESISGDYGDYGWMEHDSDGWWIEASSGNWIMVPTYYDTSKLIYIEQ